MGTSCRKVYKNEDIFDAIKRETLEETGLDISIDNFVHLKKLFVRYPDYDYVFHVFRIKFNKKPKVKIDSKEHKKHLWISPKQTSDIELILGQDLVNNMFY